MIDKLVIQIPFSASAVLGSYDHESDRTCQPWTRKGVFHVKSECLPFKKGAKEIFTDTDGNLVADDIYCPWESLESSHGGLAVKPYHEGNGMLPWPYLEIKCSPAKLVQSHNVYGTDLVYPCVENMLYVLSNAYPSLFDSETGLVALDMAEARLTEIDITYSVRVPLEAHRNALLDVLRHTSKGQTKNRGDSYQSTCYFGSASSRLKKIKVYLKGPEILQDVEKRQKKKMPIPAQSIIDDAQSLVRFELTIKKDWLERRRLPTQLRDFIQLFDNDQALLRTVYNEGMKDLIGSMKSEVLTVTDDKQVYSILEKFHGETRGRVSRLMGFYQALKAAGFDGLKKQYPERTFRRYITDLELAGFGRAHLCSLHVTKGNTVVAFPSVVRLDGLGEPAPTAYVYPLLAQVS
jgi:II/X family phage/plasmid replication protein